VNGEGQEFIIHNCSVAHMGHRRPGQHVFPAVIFTAGMGGKTGNIGKSSGGIKKQYSGTILE
jgi:hypothetical protein